MAPKHTYTFSVFICDDDAITRSVLHYQLSKLFEKNKCNVVFHIATNITEAKAIIAAQQRIDLCFLDIYLPDGNGLDLLKEIKRNNNIEYSIIMTAHSEERLAIKALKMGATDYLKKPLSEEDITNTFGEYLKLLGPKSIQTHERYKELIDDECLIQIKKLHNNDFNFIIWGESGTGKSTLLELYTHGQDKKDIYCWTISNSDEPKEEFEVTIKEFNGVVHLHDLETLTIKNQKKLLMALKTREISGRKKLKIISTSNTSIPELIKQNCFIPELYNYLSEAEIQIPPLRSVPHRIEGYANYFAEKFAESNNEPIRRISPCFINKIKLYNWPGNIRELQNFMRKILLSREESPLKWRTEDKRYFLDIKNLDDKENSLRNIELDHIKIVLEETKHNYKKAAEKLGISRSTLYRKMKTN